jgi:hypothetical protein
MSYLVHFMLTIYTCCIIYRYWNNSSRVYIYRCDEIYGQRAVELWRWTYGYNFKPDTYLYSEWNISFLCNGVYLLWK